MRKLSLVLATVGRTNELHRLFDSLATQTFNDFEIIVVDQNTDQRLQAIVTRARCLGLAIRHLWYHPPNLALARNAGSAIATGQWLGFPDDDCWYEPDSLTRIMERTQQADTPQGVICQWVEQNERHPAGLLSWKSSARFRDYPVSSITLFMRRKLICDMGGFDGRLGIGQWFGSGEETDIVLRALSKGAVIAHEPSAKIHHRVDIEYDPRSQIARRSALLRARGTGAMYAKHHLPLWVIIRGLVSPLIKPLAQGHLGAELKQGIAIAMGRLTGWIHWHNQERRSKKTP